MSDFKLILQRDSEFQQVRKSNSLKNAESSTLGKARLYNAFGEVLFECDTLENGGESTDKSGQDKRIIAREYHLAWFSSSKNGNLAKQYPKFKLAGGRSQAIQLLNASVANFDKRYILIHIGNYPQDTEGCILFGYGRGHGTIHNSVKAIKDFYEKCEKIGIENITLEIKEIGDE